MVDVKSKMIITCESRVYFFILYLYMNQARIMTKIHSRGIKTLIEISVRYRGYVKLGEIIYSTKNRSHFYVKLDIFII